MKKIITKLMLVPAMMLVAASCLEEVEPTAYLSEATKREIAKKDPAKVFDGTLNGMYTELQSAVKKDVSHNYFGQKSFDYLTSLMGNDMIMTGRFGMSLYHYLLDYWQENYDPTENRWSEYYTCIANANSIIGQIDPATTDPVQQKYLATALGFRGYAYLQLTYLYQYSYYVGVDGTIWGKGQTYDHSQKPCVPILLENTNGHQPRSTVAQVHEQITKDLTTAYNLFEAVGAIKTDSPTDIDGCVVALHLARQNMILNNWAEAEKYAQVVIDNYPVLTATSDILQGFSSINLPNVVFGCDITSDNSTVYMSWFSQMDSYSAGYAGIGVWRAAFKPLVDRIADDDVRLKWFACDRSTGIDDEESPTGRTTLLGDVMMAAQVEYQSVKFIGAGRSTVNSGVFDGWELGDYIYLRSEEAYLIKAEAQAHQKETADALNTLNTFMKTRQPSYNFTNSEYAALVEEINYQKRVEFWGEGIEYLDNRRLNIPVDRTDETWGENNNHLAAARMYVEQEGRNFLYQIPDNEMENNTALTPADQN